MASTSNTPKGRGASGTPESLAQTTPQASSFDQFSVMQSQIEIQKDLSSLNTKTERAATDLRDLTKEVKDGLKEANAATQAVVVDMARMVERVSHLPTKGFIVVSLLLSLAVIASLIVFQGNLARMVGAAPITAPIASSPPVAGLPGMQAPSATP